MKLVDCVVDVMYVTMNHESHQLLVPQKLN